MASSLMPTGKGCSVLGCACIGNVIFTWSVRTALNTPKESRPTGNTAGLAVRLEDRNGGRAG